MKTILIFLLILILGVSANAQTAKKTTPASKPASPSIPVKINYDENFQLYYLADSVTGKLIKALPAYKKVYQFSEGMALVETDKGVGFINSKGTEVVPSNGKYHWAYNYKEGFARVGINNEKGERKATGFINKAGVLAIPMNFQDAMSFNEKLAAAKKNGKWGYINKTGTFVIPAIYEDAGNFNYGIAAVSKKKTVNNETSVLYGYIDKTGKQVLPFVYSEAGDFRNTGPDSYDAIVTKDIFPMLISKNGYEQTSFTGLDDDMIVTDLQWVNESGDKILIRAKERYSYTAAYGLYSNYATVITVNPEYSEIQLTNEPNTGKEFFFLKKYGSMGLAKGYGDVIPAVYDFIQFNDTLIYAIDKVKVENDQPVGGVFSIYDLNLDLITKKEYDQITGFFDGLAKVKYGGKVGFINKKGDEVIPLIYDDAGTFSSGVALVLKNSKVGAINKAGEVVIPCEYEDMGIFTDGHAYYQKNGSKGIIDINGKIVTEPVFANMGNFSNGVAQYVKDNKVGYVNLKGEVVVDAKYDVGLPFADSVALVSLDKKVGFINLEGKEVIPLKYDDATDFRNGCALVQENEKKYLINKKGETIKKYE